MWWGGARETREPHVTIGHIVSNIEATKNLPAFPDLSGMKTYKEFQTYRSKKSLQRKNMYSNTVILILKIRPLFFKSIKYQTR